jgi:ubiquinone/menaquinone biosynthesis C-methylase UbiE
VSRLLFGGALILAIGVLLVVCIRLLSRHHSTACPAWLAVLLENPYMNTLSGGKVILDRAGIQPGMSVLDIGCGTGRIALPCAARVGPTGRVVALDLQPAMLEKLHAGIAAVGVTNIRPMLAAAGQGQLPTNGFDRALLVTVLGEIIDQQTALREVHDALTPEGILSITEVLPDPHYQSPRRVRRLASEAGFRFHERIGPWYAFTMNFTRDT